MKPGGPANIIAAMAARSAVAVTLLLFDVAIASTGVRGWGELRAESSGIASEFGDHVERRRMAGQRSAA